MNSQEILGNELGSTSAQHASFDAMIHALVEGSLSTFPTFGINEDSDKYMNLFNLFFYNKCPEYSNVNKKLCLLIDMQL